MCVICSSIFSLLRTPYRVLFSSLRKKLNPFTARVDDGVCGVVLTFTSVDKILCCDHSNEMSLEVLSCGVICVKKNLQNEIWDFCLICLLSYLAVKGLISVPSPPNPSLYLFSVSLLAVIKKKEKCPGTS